MEVDPIGALKPAVCVDVGPPGTGGGELLGTFAREFADSADDGGGNEAAGSAVLDGLAATFRLASHPMPGTWENEPPERHPAHMLIPRHSNPSLETRMVTPRRYMSIDRPAKY